MGEQVAASTKKEKRESFSERTAWSGPCNLNQQGSAVQITGFTSDQSKGESSCVLMADKTSVKNKKNRYANLNAYLCTLKTAYMKDLVYL